jgi:hypothetical protein
MTRLLLCTATILALTAITPASAQREGGAFFGPFSRGDSSGASYFPPMCPSNLRNCNAPHDTNAVYPKRRNATRRR